MIYGITKSEIIFEQFYPICFTQVSQENRGKIGLVRERDYQEYFRVELLSESCIDY